MPEVQWYYARNDQQFGPVSAGELKQLAAAGQLTPDDLLWREGMDAWTTAVNLRGLFGEEPPAAAKTTAPAPVVVAPPAADRAGRSATPGPSHTYSMVSLVRATQAILWVICALIVLIGAVLFTRAFLEAQDATQEAAAGAVFSTFFIGAYVLARAGEKLGRLLIAASRRRRR
jgi:hypothetical protein